MKLFAFGLIAELYVLLYALQQPEAPVDIATKPPSVFGNMDGTVQMQIVILIATIAGFLFQYVMFRSKAAEDRRKDELRIREQEQQRKYDLEDRQFAREEAIKRVERLHTKIEEVKGEAQGAAREAQGAVREAQATAQRVDEHSAQLSQKIEENTQLSRDAFNAANNFNNKLEEIIRPFRESEAALEVSQTTLRAVPQGGEEHDDAGQTKAPSSD